MLIHEKQFDSKYRMSYESFMRLVTLLEPNLRQDDRKSMNSCGQLAICPPHILGLTIRWLSGSSFHDIRDAGNFSRPSFFCLLRKGLRAILTCKELQITLPNTQDELDEVLEGFKSKSIEEVMSGCVHWMAYCCLFILQQGRRHRMSEFITVGIIRGWV